jgi:hypothetical protein
MMAAERPRYYGAGPIGVEGPWDIELDEVMYYLYLPIRMPSTELRVPRNLECLQPLIHASLQHASRLRRVRDDYVYISARKGWATPDNPLNRPGWHADGFGTDDLNYVYWVGPGTRFLVGDLGDVPADHAASLRVFELLADWCPDKIITDLPEKTLYMLDPYVVHATPAITKPCWRQFIKISLSSHRYNLENNSHNYLFDYDWPLHSREEVRNDTFKAQRDFT